VKCHVLVLSDQELQKKNILGNLEDFFCFLDLWINKMEDCGVHYPLFLLENAKFNLLLINKQLRLAQETNQKVRI
jgi:hypothetical protein